MSAPTSRPVHPCVLSVFDGTIGAEYSTWARLTITTLPNLVTAQSSTLRIYQVSEVTGTMILIQSFSNLAGSVCYLETLTSSWSDEPDALLIGFAGHPRLAIVTLSQNKQTNNSYPLLLATSLLDLTPALVEASLGSVTSLEQDMIVTVDQKKRNNNQNKNSKNNRSVTLSIVLGGGVAVAALTLQHKKQHGETKSNGGWMASDPYLLPLATLCHKSFNSDSSMLMTTTKTKKTPITTTTTPTAPSIAHGFGDIVHACFLEGYLEPTLCLLHSNKLGRTWAGRLGRTDDTNAITGTRHFMVVTAMSVTVLHQRSAVLWSVPVPADALSLQPHKGGVMVVSVNSVMHIANSGAVQNVLGVNGWVRSTLPPGLDVQPNPWPLPKLAIQLDGAHVAVVVDDDDDATSAIVALRGGELYMMHWNGKHCGLSPLGQTLGAIGQVANLVAWPLGDFKQVLSKKIVKVDAQGTKLGLLFAGSRMGDASLLGYGLQTKALLTENIVIKQEGGIKRKREEDSSNESTNKEPTNAVNGVSEEYESILQLEEDALYAPVDSEQQSQPDIIPPSDDEEEVAATEEAEPSRPRLKHMTVVRSLTALDSITSLGPVGPGCVGPLSHPPPKKEGASVSFDPLPSAGTLVSDAHVLPCGYGSSGGLALVTTPGRDDRTILAEADCLNMTCLFGLPRHGLVLLGKESGVHVLRLTEQTELNDVDLSEWCGSSEPDSATLWDALHVLTQTKLRSASEMSDEFNETNIVLLVEDVNEKKEPTNAIVVLKNGEDEGNLQVKFVYEIGQGQGALLSATPMIRHDDDWSPTLYFGCTWSSGNGTITTIRPPNANDEEFTGSDTVLVGGEGGVEKMKIDDDEENEERQYYQSERVVAMDVFVAPKGIFTTSSKDGTKSKTTPKKTAAATTDTPSSSVIPSNEMQSEFDEEDLELYASVDGETTAPSPPSQSPPVVPSIDGKDRELYVGVCRQSGTLQIYRLPVVGGTVMKPEMIWEAQGGGHGVPVLEPTRDGIAPPRKPRMHKVHAAEIRFFVCGPSLDQSKKLQPADAASEFRTLCIAMETNAGDVYLYKIQRSSKLGTTFARSPLGVVGRPSLEQSRHRAKLKRKGIVASSGNDEETQGSVLRYNRLHPFCGISGQDGLFAATSRPLWFVCERGSPTYLCHRSRHVAPAGGKFRPVSGFCNGLLKGNTGFLTLHERIGRVGSQRLTFFRGISNMFSPHGLFPGSGLSVEKVPLGVTVRRIEFIDDTNVSSGDHPLYAALISHESDSDQSNLNDDGLTPEERQQLKEEKENDKMKRQVEADLGGFDMEQEWVEEIERENCFEVDQSIGGAPPIGKSAYSLWIVDASNNWNVVDSYQLGEYEHGLTMSVMSLTDVPDETGTTAAIGENEEVDSLFITVGTGIVDQDGEDVGSKGRVLLFDVKRRKPGVSGALAELSLVYEKDIMHGPVNSLSCLSCEGRRRIIIGAGSDVNVEQWGNGKLTQVGFFRAQMHILDIMLFKTFFLLSDAYDSLYFLVWRESDKSLTLLAKDYEPVPVYAASILSRGGSVSFVCHDDRQNLQLFQYAPGEAAARGGNKLVCRADYHLGSQTVSMQNHFCRSSLLINSATTASTLEALKQQDTFVGRTDDDQRMGVNFGTSDGGLVAVVPLSEPIYWRLTALQSVLTNALESHCALSHRAWRLYRRTPRRGGCRSNDRKKGVIDGDLVSQFADLELAEQEDLASAIGSTVELILDNLLEVRCSSMVV